jgi:hypothetical protein
MKNKEALDARISANYLAHNHAEVMRLAYMMCSHLTEDQIKMVLDATEIPLFGDVAVSA